MAMSFARPDPSSPASVADASFGTSRRGFDQSQVRDFLRMIAAEMGRLQERERFLERELRTAQTNPDLESVQLDEQTLTRLLGEETARVLSTARESAAEIRAKAEQSAAQLLNEASDEAARLREEAEVEASRRRADAAGDAEAELQMAKQQGREMVNEARAYRERVLSELARRRELAREQIEQLVHGRDRLMQSFERARLVAVDVVSELQPLGEPDEYVNLTPTTGPVPVMVPNQRPEVDTDIPVASDTAASDTAASDTAASDTAGSDMAGSDTVASDDEVEPEVVAEPGVEVESEVVAEPGVEVEPEVVAEPGVEVEPEVVVAASESDVVAEPEVDEISAPSVPETEPEVDENATAADGPESETSADESSGSTEEHDDVVVDLFARLRASTEVTGDDDAEPHAEPHAEAISSTSVPVSGTEADEDAPAAETETDADTDTDTDADTDARSEPTAFDQRRADLTPLIVASAKKLKRVLADEQNEVLDALRRSESARHVDALLPWSSEHAGRYREAIAGELFQAAQAGAASIPDDRGRPTKLRKADAIKASTAAHEVLEEWLVTPLRERLERCVADGDGDNGDIGKRARSVYREWKTQHIDEQLDDVFRTAHGRGVLAALEPGTLVRWVADDGAQVCADCDDNTLAGTVEAGSAFPTGHVAAPAHIGCRCLLIPEPR